jgi:hypothetical protein
MSAVVLSTICYLSFNCSNTLSLSRVPRSSVPDLLISRDNTKLKALACYAPVILSACNPCNPAVLADSNKSVATARGAKH